MSGAEPEPNGFEQLLGYVRESRAFDFTGYKRPSLGRRINKRIQALGLEPDDFEGYRELLEAQPEEFSLLFDTILINVTSFFRDRPAWDYLGEEVIGRILASTPAGKNIRVWSAGCATGEEVYSLAILLCEAAGEDRFREGVKIYGTDVDDDALAIARMGRYPERTLRNGLSDEQIGRYFDRGDDEPVFRTDLRRSVIFGRHDLLQDAPISRVDLLACRNTLMYFNSDTQRRVLANFHFALNREGFLFLGKSEALATRTNLFVLDQPQFHIFSKKDGPHFRPPLPRFAPAPRDSGSADELLEVAFEAGPVAQLVLDRGGRIQHTNQHARSLFGLGAGDVGRPFKDFEVSYRPVELRSRVEQVFEDRHPMVISDVALELPGGSVEFLEVQVLPVGAETVIGVIITFTPVGQHKALRDELQRSQRELETAYEELQSTVEELETTNEELQSTNEELETTNEELQSTNEELETMNEELQSTNEELETINNELRQRSTDLDDANDFLRGILTSLGSGVAVLNRDMAVRVWNRQAEELWGLRAEEVQGEHFLNLDIGLPVEELRAPIRACLNGKSSAEHRVLGAVNRRGRSIECEVSISPLLDELGSPDGVIVRMEPADKT